jgi:ADP-ribosyl-[dinitrogen reductase] hydrolase
VFHQKDPKDCPDNDSHNVDTIDGLVLPTIVAMTGVSSSSLNNNNDAAAAAQAAAECASVTRKSKVLERVSAAWSNVIVAALLTTSPPPSSSSSNNNSNGPPANSNNNQFVQEFNKFAIQTVGKKPNSNVDDSSTMSACYLSSALPGLIDMIAKYNVVDDDTSNSSSSSSSNKNLVWEGLLANANVGGENVHRGSVMGAVLGARAGYRALPSHLMDGLYHHDELEKEIDDFVKAVLS